MAPKSEKQIPVSGYGLNEIFPLFCGFEDCEGEHAYGPSIREHYLVHYVRKGQGYFTCGGKTYTVTQGQCFLISPREITYYIADKNDPWHYTWLAFYGDFASVFMKAAGYDTDNPIIDSPGIGKVFRNIHEKVLSEEKITQFWLLSSLYAFFDSLPTLDTAETRGEKYINKVKAYVSAAYATSLSVEQLASYCGLDRRYLGRVFKEGTGHTLQQYLMSVRMEKARALLLNSTLSIGDVARSVGYYDVFNFSKMFKQKYGLSPALFRKTAK